jgi:tetratricopeptide (TPR) repeat protein
MSRYTAVTESVIEKCQQDYRAGRDLGHSIPSMSTTEAAVVVAESLDADRLLEANLEQLLELPLDPMNDWSLAALAEYLFFFEHQSRAIPEIPEEERRILQDRAWTALEQALDSPTGSPMLWYEDVYFDVAQAYRTKGDRRAVELLKRGLAHNLHYNEGNNADGFLRDLAETYLWVNEFDQGLVMWAALLRNDPSDIWTYNVMALTFDRFGLAELGTEVTQRGLEVIEATGDPEGLHDQLSEALDRLQQSEKRGGEANVDPAVLADFRMALALDMTAGRHRPIGELCRDLVPDLDRIPVKSPPPMPELPPLSSAKARQPRVRPTELKLGRNEPCWCGSGKKYKHCHRREDLGRT